MSTHTDKTAQTCLLITLGILLGYVENLFLVTPFPGIKVGLSNTVVLYSLFRLDIKNTYIVGIFKSILNGILFSGILSILYGSFSIVISIFAMDFLKKKYFPENVSVYGISVAGSVSFNIMQILIASVLLKTTAVYYYMPFMITASLFTGLFIAIITKFIIKQIRG